MYSTQKQLENFEEIFQGKAIKVRKNTWRRNVNEYTTNDSEFGLKHRCKAVIVMAEKVMINKILNIGVVLV